MRLTATVLLLALLAAGCSSDRTDPSDGGPVQPAPEGARAATFSCADGTRLQVRFENGQALVTTGAGSDLTLPQQRAASGFWYSSGQHELRGKGDDATWTVGGGSGTDCKAVRSSS